MRTLPGEEQHVSFAIDKVSFVSNLNIDALERRQDHGGRCISTNRVRIPLARTRSAGSCGWNGSIDQYNDDLVLPTDLYEPYSLPPNEAVARAREMDKEVRGMVARFVMLLLCCLYS